MCTRGLPRTALLSRNSTLQHTEHTATAASPERCFPSSPPLPGSPASEPPALGDSLALPGWHPLPPAMAGVRLPSGLGLQVQGHFVSPSPHSPPSKCHSHDSGQGPPFQTFLIDSDSCGHKQGCGQGWGILGTFCLVTDPNAPPRGPLGSLMPAPWWGVQVSPCSWVCSLEH